MAIVRREPPNRGVECRCERHKSGSSGIAGLAIDRWRAGPVNNNCENPPCRAPTATHQWIYIYRSLQHARLRRRQNRTVYAVLNLKQNLRSTYCSEARDWQVASRDLFATAELLVVLVLHVKTILFLRLTCVTINDDDDDDLVTR